MRCSRCGTELPADARFCLSCGASVAGLPAAEERKFVSVLFVDVVGSTAHADGADPEDVRDRNQLYYERPATGSNGTAGRREVRRRRGDGGVRRAARAERRRRTRRARRALHPGGDRGAERARPRPRPRVRAGVCTGEAIVAVDAAPADALATGDVVNTAARLQSAAPHGRVVVGAETYRLTRHAFDFRGARRRSTRRASATRCPPGSWAVDRARRRIDPRRRRRSWARPGGAADPHGVGSGRHRGFAAPRHGARPRRDRQV